MRLSDIFEQYGFSTLWSPNVLALTLVIAIAYLLVTGVFRKRFSESSPVPLRQKVYFLSGLAAFCIAQGSPLNFLGHQYMFSAHMTQMALCYMVMPPLVLLGIPGWIWNILLKRAFMHRLFTVLTHPFVALVLFNGLFSLYHFPIVLDTVMANYGVHMLYHNLLILGAILLWWPVVSPIPGYGAMTDLVKIAYLFGGGVLITPVCAMIIFANTQVYATYSDAPQLFAFLSTFDDQQLGGIIMKIVQEITYGTAIGIIFFKWVGKDKSDTTIDPIEPLETKDEHVTVSTPSLQPQEASE